MGLRSISSELITLLYSSLILVLIVPITAFVLLPLCVLRIFVYFSSRLFGPIGIAGMIGQLCGLHAVDDLSTKPLGNLLVALYLEDKFDLNTLVETFRTKVLNKANSKGKLQYPELQQIVCHFMGYSFWKWDSNFVPENHCSIYKAGEGEIIDQAGLVRIRQKLVLRPWKKDTPVWEAVIIENFKSEEYPSATVLLFLAHHILMDGYSIINILVEDFTRISLEKVIARPVGYGDQAFGILSKGLSSIVFPMKAIHQFSAELQRGINQNAWNRSDIPMNRNGSFSHANSISVSYIKEIKNAHGVSFTAVLLGAISAAIRNGMKMEGLPVPGHVDSFTVIPMPGHPKKLTNHLSHAIIPLPTGNPDPRSRLLEIERTIQKMKCSTIPILNFWFAQFLGNLPRCIIRKVVNQKFPATLAISNFPAPNEKVRVQGTRIYRVEFDAGPMLALPLGFACLTYNGKACIFAGVDSAVPGHEKVSHTLIEYFQRELDLLHQATTP